MSIFALMKDVCNLMMIIYYEGSSVTKATTTATIVLGNVIFPTNTRLMEPTYHNKSMMMSGERDGGDGRGLPVY